MNKQHVMKLIIAGCLVVGIVGCTQQPRMGAALEEMVQAQTDPEVSADNVGAMAGIGDRVGAAYRGAGAADHPEQVKESMGVQFFGKK